MDSFWLVVFLISIAIIRILSGIYAHLRKNTDRAIVETWPSTELSGREFARKLIEVFGLTDVSLKKARADDFAHYRAKRKSLVLCGRLLSGRDELAHSVVAHEVAHAISFQGRDRVVQLYEAKHKLLKSQLHIIFGLFVVSFFTDLETARDMIFWAGALLLAILIPIEIIELVEEKLADQFAVQLKEAAKESYKMDCTIFQANSFGTHLLHTLKLGAYIIAEVSLAMFIRTFFH